MQLFCDRCNESVDHPIDIRSDVELAEIARDLGYRSVCSGCYDDLVVEAGETREHQADDRRSEHRVAAHVTLRVTPNGGESHETISEDVSDNGARVRSPTGLAFDVGTVLRIECLDGGPEAVAIVETVWADGEGKHAGLRLVESSESWQELVRELERGGGGTDT